MLGKLSLQSSHQRDTLTPKRPDYARDGRNLRARCWVLRNGCVDVGPQPTVADGQPLK